MPRHNPTTRTADDGRDRHGERLGRDSRARSRRLQTASEDGFRRRRLISGSRRADRELEQQVADWRSELMPGY